VQPAIVVLELDEKRYRKLMQSAASSDPFGVQRAAHGGVLKVT
jgi:pheromone shutdown protein TraB